MAPIFAMRTLVVSRGRSAARGPRGERIPAAPASVIVARKRRRVCIMGIEGLPFFRRSRLQLASELVEETPVGVEVALSASFIAPQSLSIPI